MSEASAESYFHAPAREAFSSAVRFEGEQRPLPTDKEGYVMRNSVNDEITRLDYVIPIGPTDGVWSMIKRVREFRTEGWPALWKGTLYTSARDEGTLSDIYLGAT